MLLFALHRNTVGHSDFAPYTCVNSRHGQQRMDTWQTISIKQPWAALLVAGVKTVEVRTWSTTLRGPVLIHAGRSADARPEAWAHITTPELRAAANRLGGLVGWATLTECRTYLTAEQFAAEAVQHLNPTAWYAPPRLFGFRFVKPQPLPFRPLPGKLFFFPVNGLVVSPPELPTAAHQAQDAPPP